MDPPPSTRDSLKSETPFRQGDLQGGVQTLSCPPRSCCHFWKEGVRSTTRKRSSQHPVLIIFDYLWWSLWSSMELCLDLSPSGGWNLPGMSSAALPQSLGWEAGPSWFSEPRTGKRELQLEPDNRSFQTGLGMALYSSWSFSWHPDVTSKAIIQLERIVDEQPNNYRAKIYLARLLGQVNRGKKKNQLAWWKNVKRKALTLRSSNNQFCSGRQSKPWSRTWVIIFSTRLCRA